VRFKAYDAARFTGLLDWAQARRLDLEVIYSHEPQDDCSTKPNACGPVYKRVYAQMDAHRSSRQPGRAAGSGDPNRAMTHLGATIVTPSAGTRRCTRIGCVGWSWG
jgi:hypothetical protein